MHLSTVITSFVLTSATGWAQYVLEDDFMNGDFFDKFSFWDTADPTDGFVEYKDQSYASANGLIEQSSGNVKLKVDSTNVTPNGRPSVRLTSNKSYQNGLLIADIEHMPGGVCGTWPAMWFVGPDWPSQGEIDIIEGVNEQTTNAMTLHTGPGCSISKTNALFSGSINTDNCDVNAAGQPDNAGCSIDTSNTQTYGTGFNAIGGGVYATEITASSISIYFFPRGSIPSDITNGSPDPSSWGTPLAQFEGGCDIASTFTNQQLVFDTTFCGSWAGEVWSSSSCATAQYSTCNAFVENQPSAFTEAYWSINALKMYSGSGGSSSPSSAAPAPSSTAVSVPVQQSSTISYNYTTQSVGTAPWTTQYTTTAKSSAAVPTGPAVTPSTPVTSWVQTSATPATSSPPETSTSWDQPAQPWTATATAPWQPQWSETSDGDGGYDVSSPVKERHARHARHLRFHKRHGHSRF